jgi:hypothetical protein
MANPPVVGKSKATDADLGMRRVEFSRLGGPGVLEIVPLRLPPLKAGHVPGEDPRDRAEPV